MREVLQLKEERLDLQRSALFDLQATIDAAAPRKVGIAKTMPSALVSCATFRAISTIHAVLLVSAQRHHNQRNMPIPMWSVTLYTA